MRDTVLAPQACPPGRRQREGGEPGRPCLERLHHPVNTKEETATAKHGESQRVPRHPPALRLNLPAPGGGRSGARRALLRTPGRAGQGPPRLP